MHKDDGPASVRYLNNYILINTISTKILPNNSPEKIFPEPGSLCEP